MNYALSILLICFSILGVSQEYEKVFFDKDWYPSSEKKHRYYRLLQVGKDRITIRDYDKSGKSEYHGVHSSNDTTLMPYFRLTGHIPDSIMATSTYYDKLGQREFEYIFDFDLLWEEIPEVLRDSIPSKESVTGQSFYIHYRPNGKMEYGGFIKDGQFEGLYVDFYDEPFSPYIIAEYQGGKLSGNLVYYYMDFKPMEACHYVKGQKHGISLHFLHDGSVDAVKYFENGKEISIGTEETEP